MKDRAIISGKNRSALDLARFKAGSAARFALFSALVFLNAGAAVPANATKTVYLPQGVPIEMVWCGPGVLLGLHGRTIVEESMRGFWISKCELTQAQWNAVMDENPSEFKGDRLPVENLCWDDCALYLSKLNAKSKMTFRLPTGNEWEYAARGGPKGNPAAFSEKLTAFSWHGENSEGRTHVGGRKPANSLGLCDMVGNVWEWCADDGKTKNTTKRELRGGAFYTHNPKLLAYDGRMLVEQDTIGRGAGMRLVSDKL